MEDVSPFATHVARLVWLLAHRPGHQDEQKEQLRQALAGLSNDSQSLSVHDIAAAVSSAASAGIEDEDAEAVAELAMRMASHSVRNLMFEPLLPARELLEVARALAADASPGDDGAAFDEALVGLHLTGVNAQIGMSGFVRRPTPGAVPAYTGPVRTPSYSLGAVNGAEPTPPPRTARAAAAAKASNESQAIMQAQLMGPAKGGDVAQLIARLDRGLNSHEAPAVIDEVSRSAEDLANRGQWVDLVHVLDRMHQHHDRLHEGDAKRAVMMGLRRLQRPTLLHGVARMLTVQRDMRDLCTRLLVKAGETGAEVLIDNLIGSEVATERSAYLAALRQCPAAATSLMHLLSDDRWYVVRNAAALLGELGASESDRWLAELISHREPRVRRVAVTALGKLATSRALLALLQAIDDESPEVRVQAVHAIAAAGNPRAVPWLIEALDREQDQDVTVALLAALGRLPTEDGIARLARAAEAGGMLIRKPAAMRLRAIESLAEAGTPSARQVLEGLTSDRDREIRAAVAQAVGRLATA